MSTWRATWSMVGRWLVYVPNPEGGEEQISLPEHMKAEAHKLAAADDLLAALERVVAIADRKTAEFDMAHDAIARAHGEAR